MDKKIITGAIIVLGIVVLGGVYSASREAPSAEPLDTQEYLEQVLSEESGIDTGIRDTASANVSTTTTPPVQVSTGGVNVKGPLDGLGFRLLTYNGVGFLPGTTYLLGFNEGKINASFCNSMTGTYSISGTRISTTGLASTKKLCNSPVDIMEHEASFSRNLTNGATYTLEGATLTIKGEDTFVFIRQ